jgi:hypothetical protein
MAVDTIDNKTICNRTPESHGCVLLTAIRIKNLVTCTYNKLEIFVFDMDQASSWIFAAYRMSIDIVI